MTSPDKEQHQVSMWIDIIAVGDWVEFEIVTGDISQYNDLEYELTFPDGSKEIGIIDNSKTIRVDNIDPGKGKAGQPVELRWVNV